MNEHFLTGFFKQAAIHNIGEEEALELLKDAAPKLPPIKKFKNNPFGKIHHYFSEHGGDSLGYRKALWGSGGLFAGAAGLDAYRNSKSKKKKDASKKSE